MIVVVGIHHGHVHHGHVTLHHRHGLGLVILVVFGRRFLSGWRRFISRRSALVPLPEPVDELVLLAVVAQPAAFAHLPELRDPVASHLVDLEGRDVIELFLLGRLSRRRLVHDARTLRLRLNRLNRLNLDSGGWR